MIVIDTNVVSEMMKSVPDAQVHRWLDGQVAETLFLSSVTLAELLFGIAALPDGKPKAGIAEMVDGIVTLFDGRILPFDTEAARHYDKLAVRARMAGKGFPTPDGYIAAIAASRGFTVATRDTAPFKAAGVQTINPWNSSL